MGYRSDVAIVMWKPDFEDMIKEGMTKDFASDFLSWIEEMDPQEIITPDEAYVHLHVNDVKWYTGPYGYPEIDFIDKFVKRQRHAFVRIGEERGDIEYDVKDTDSRGCDEEFYYFLDLETKIEYDLPGTERKLNLNEITNKNDVYSIRIYDTSTDNLIYEVKNIKSKEEAISEIEKDADASNYNHHYRIYNETSRNIDWVYAKDIKKGSFLEDIDEEDIER